MPLDKNLERKKEKIGTLVKELEGINKTSRATLRNVNATYSKIEKKELSFEKFISKLDTIKSDATYSLGIVKNNIKEGNKISSSLGKIQNIISSKYDSIAKSKEKADTLKKSIESLHAKSVDNNSKTNDLLIESTKTRDLASEVLQEIEGLRTSSTIDSGLVKEDKESSSHLLTLMQEDKDDSTILYKRIEDDKKSSTKILGEINRDKVSSSEVLDEINKDKVSSTETIKGYEDNAIQTLHNIQNIYHIAHDTKLGGEFEKRREEHHNELKKWAYKIKFWSIILTICIIVLFAIQLFLYKGDIKNVTFDVNFYVRFLIFSPIIFYIVFCTNQYQRTNKLCDKYGFKAATAFSLKDHIELLSNNEKFNNPEDLVKILDFTLGSFKDIYMEPNSDNGYKIKLKMANLEVNLRKEFLKKIRKMGGSKEETKDD